MIEGDFNLVYEQLLDNELYYISEYKMASNNKQDDGFPDYSNWDLMNIIYDFLQTNWEKYEGRVVAFAHGEKPIYKNEEFFLSTYTYTNAELLINSTADFCPDDKQIVLLIKTPIVITNASRSYIGYYGNTVIV